MTEPVIEVAAEAAVTAAAPVVAPKPPKASADATVSTGSNLEPRDPAEEYATAARNEKVLEMAARYEEAGDTAAAARIKAKYGL